VERAAQLGNPADTFNGLKLCPGQNKWFKITVGDGNSAAVAVQGAEGSPKLNLELLASDGTTVVAKGDSNANLVKIMQGSLSQGSYYIHVSSTESTKAATFLLSYAILTASCTDSKEPMNRPTMRYFSMKPSTRGSSCAPSMWTGSPTKYRRTRP